MYLLQNFTLHLPPLHAYYLTARFTINDRIMSMLQVSRSYQLPQTPLAMKWRSYWSNDSFKAHSSPAEPFLYALIHLHCRFLSNHSNCVRFMISYAPLTKKYVTLRKQSVFSCADFPRIRLHTSGPIPGLSVLSYFSSTVTYHLSTLSYRSAVCPSLLSSIPIAPLTSSSS